MTDLVSAAIDDDDDDGGSSRMPFSAVLSFWLSFSARMQGKSPCVSSSVMRTNCSRKIPDFEILQLVSFCLFVAYF